MPEQNLTPLPEGVEESEVVKPVALAKELDIRPQIVYGWIRNSGLPAHTKPEGENGEQKGRYILRSEFAEWQQAKEEKKAERERKKAEKEAKEAEKAAAKAEGADASDDGDDDDDEDI